MKSVNLTTPVNLLLKAQVTAISELAAKTPRLLADDMKTIATAVGDNCGQTAEVVRRWIEHANTNTKPIVS